MINRRKDLEDSARLLRVRLSNLEDRRQTVPEVDRPANEVATDAIRAELSKVGLQLKRMDY
jgi:hypothetical protein